MPSMRMNTQAPAAGAASGEWQTVGTKVKTKKSKQEDTVADSPAVSSQPARPVPVPTRAPIIAQVSSNGALNPFHPEELGAEVLAAYDQSWNAGVGGNAHKNGKSKVAEAPALPASSQAPRDASAPVQPATNGSAPPQTKASKPKKKKKSKAAAGADSAAAPRENGSQADAPEPAQAPKPAKQPKSKAPAATNGAQARSASKASSTIASVSHQTAVVVELDTYLMTLEEKHPGEGLLQLQLLSAWLSRAFASVSYHQSVILDRAGVAGALDDPWRDVAAPLRDSLLAFIGCCNTQHAAHFLAQTAEQTLAALPEKGGAATDVGQLLTLIAVCRGAPLALPAACTTLSHLRSKLLSPGRIPMLLWLLGQAAKAGSEGSACAVNCWARVVLPSIVHQEVAPVATKPAKKGKGSGKSGKPQSVYHMEPAARDAAVAFFHEVLLDREGTHHRKALMFAARDGLPCGADAATEPVAPVAAVAAADAAADGSVLTTRGTPELIEGVRGPLADLCACCAAPAAISAAITRALVAADSAEGFTAAQAAAAAVADQLVRHGTDAADVWGRLHRMHLGGSTAVLEHFARNGGALQPLLSKVDGSDVLLRAMDALQRAHAGVLASTKQTPARELAARAQRALDDLGSSSVKVIPASATWSLVSLAGVAIAAVALATRNEKLVQGLLEPVMGQANAGAVTSGLAGFGRTVAELCSGLWDSFSGQT